MQVGHAGDQRPGQTLGLADRAVRTQCDDQALRVHLQLDFARPTVRQQRAAGVVAAVHPHEGSSSASSGVSSS